MRFIRRAAILSAAIAMLALPNFADDKNAQPGNDPANPSKSASHDDASSKAAASAASQPAASPAGPAAALSSA
ncbi:MAG: hypothetical protein WCC15_13225, partial [Candidatus Acidiferrales bacterium]